MSDAQRYLEALHPTVAAGEYLELRCMQGEKVKQFWCTTHAQTLATAAHYSESGWQVYVSVHARDRRHGGDACVPRLRALIADVDAKLWGDDGLALAHAAIAAFDLAPSLVVCSGGGYHCYWLLEEPIAHDEESGARYRSLCRRLARAICGVMRRPDSIGTPESVLRLPGTLNWKEAYSRARPVTLVACDVDLRYTFDGLETWLDAHAPWTADSSPAKPFAPRERRDSLIADFNARYDAGALLLAHGARELRGGRGCRFFAKPGQHTISATLDYYPGVLVLQAERFLGLEKSEQRGYDTFELFTRLEHGGSHRAADSAARALGYGPGESLGENRQVADAAAARIAELEAAIAAREAELAAARQHVEDQQFELDRLHASPAEQRNAQLARELARVSGQVHDMEKLVFYPELKPGPRIAALGTMLKGRLFRSRATIGMEPELPEPARIAVAELEMELGIAAGSYSKVIRPVLDRRLLVRTLHGYKAPLPGGGEGDRCDVIMALGEELVTPDFNEIRRRRVETAKLRSRQRKDKTVNSLLRAQPLLERAKERARATCSCGGQLLPERYFCPSCLSRHTAAEVATLPFADSHLAIFANSPDAGNGHGEGSAVLPGAGNRPADTPARGSVPVEPAIPSTNGHHRNGLGVHAGPEQGMTWPTNGNGRAHGDEDLANIANENTRSRYRSLAKNDNSADLIDEDEWERHF